MPEVKEFYTPDEVEPGMLAGMRLELEPRQRRILDLVDVVEHDDEQIELEVFIQQPDRFAPLVGFTDPTILFKDLEVDTQRVSPFHMRAGHPFDIRSKFVSKQGGQYMISAAGMAWAMEQLERARLNRYVHAILSMINDRQFTYVDDPDDPQKTITVPYTADVGTLDDPSSDIGAGYKPYKESDLAKAAYYDLTGQVPTVALLSGKTAAEHKEVTGVTETIQPQAPRDVALAGDTAGASWEEYDFNGIRHIVMHDKYPTADGTLKDAVDEGYIVYMAATLAADGSPMLKMHKARNIENEFDASSPFYEMLQISNDTWKAAEKFYDNMIPGIGRRNGVVKQKLYTP